MSDARSPNGSDSRQRTPRRNHELRARFVRLRALRSAWGGIAPSGLAAEKQNVAEAGRDLNDELMELASVQGPESDPAGLSDIDGRLDEFESELRSIALRIPVSQLRSTLPALLETDRRGVLDLLDLMLDAEIAGMGVAESRIGAIDYLITLLTTEGSCEGVPLQDPVTLTPRLYGLCQQSDLDDDSELTQIESEFFAAADMSADDVREEMALRRLRQRKAELGSKYFSPRVLRAIISYNAALVKRISEEVSASRDWGLLFPSFEGWEDEALEDVESGSSLFDTPAVRELAGALRRRADGAAASVNDLDRIAWCLDLSYPDRDERDALLAESVGTREDPKGTAILIGLLVRASVVLDDELPSIGISPNQLSVHWVKELDQILKREVDRLMAAGEFEEACTLSELKTKFLYAQLAEARPKATHRPPTTDNTPVTEAAEQAASKRRTLETAHDLAREALSEDADRTGGSEGSVDWSTLPWARLGRFGAGALAACLAAFVIFQVATPDSSLDRVGGKELERLSPYLTRGSHNLNTAVPVFVGTVDESWLELDEDARFEAAADLIAALQARGVGQIMVYDEDRALRIQALGGGPVQVLAPEPRRN